jgi:hypothetical protein
MPSPALSRTWEQVGMVLVPVLAPHNAFCGGNKTAYFFFRHIYGTYFYSYNNKTFYFQDWGALCNNNYSVSVLLLL